MAAEAFPFELDVCSHCEQVYRRQDPRQIATMAIKPVLKVRYVVEMPGHRTKHFNSRISAYRRYAWLKIRDAYPCDGSCAAEYDGEGRQIMAGPCLGGVHHPTRDEESPYTRTPRSRRDTVQYLQVRFVRWLMWHDARLRGGKRVGGQKRRSVSSEAAA